MSRHKKIRRARSPNVSVPDIHMAIGSIRDASVFRNSAAVDAAADRKWFLEHPKAEERTRSISIRETLATGCPLGTTVVVRRGPAGTQIRVFLREDGDRN